LLKPILDANHCTFLEEQLQAFWVASLLPSLTRGRLANEQPAMSTDDVEKAQQHSSPPQVQPLPQTQRITSENASHLSSTRLLLVTTSLCLAAVLYGLDMNIIGVAVPVITTQFHSLDDIAWYSAAYLLAITAFQPAFGNVYKYFPAKRVFGGSVFVFEGMYAIRGV
jgi:hypothetical protein